MAGTITNIINTIFRTEGADRTERDTNRVGRAQTRLGQTSASAGREFSAQASGLGGLVAAYAGAAATTFALSAAFDALARSARAAQTLEGLTSIAAASAESGERILQSVRDITNAQLTITEAAQQINLSLSAGFDSSQIAGLSEVALKASRALGRDLTDAFTRVVRGSAKLETELLDELGIYTKIDPATRSYAAAIGKTASELTEYERRQAFVNSVIEEGQRKYASINTTVPTTAEKIEAFGKKIQDLTTIIGKFIAEALAPLAEFLTENVGASIGTLGLAGALALGKTLEVLRGGLTSFQDKIEERAARASSFFQSFNRQAAQAGQAAIRDISLSPVGLAGGLRPELKALRDLSQQRNLSNTELRRANSLLQQRQTNLQANRAELLQKRAAELAVRNATASTNAQITEANKKIQEFNAKLRRVAAASIQTTAQITALSAATTGYGSAAATAAAIATKGFLKLNAVLAITALRLLSFAGFAVGAVSIIGLLGSAIAKAAGKGDEFNAFLEATGGIIKGFLTNADKAEKKDIFLGATANALEQIEAVDSGLRELEEFEFKKQKAIFGLIEFNVTKTKQDLVNEVSSILADVANESEKTIGESVASGTTAAFAGIGAAIGTFFGPVIGTVIGAALGAGVGTIVEYFSTDEITIDGATRNRLSAEFADSLNAATPDVQEKLIQALARVEEKYASAAAADPVAAAALKLQKQLIVNSAEVLENVNAIADVIAATGQSAQLISKNYDFESVGDGLLSAYTDAITTIEGVTITFRSFDIDSEEVQRVLNEKIRGSINSIEQRFQTIGIETTTSVSLSPEVVVKDINSIKNKLKDIPVEKITKDFDIENLLKGLEFAPLINGLNDLYDAAEEGDTTALDAFKNALSSLIKLNTNFTGESIAKPFTAFSTSLNIANQESVRAIEVLRSVSEGVNNLSISYEQFQQSIGNAEKALERADSGLVESANKLKALRDARAKLSDEELPAQDALIEAEEDRFRELIKTIEGAKELLGILKEQEESFKRQADIQQFLKDIGTKSKNVFTLQFEIATESGQSPFEALSSIFSNSELADAAAIYNQFADNATEVLESIGVGSDVIASVLKTGTDNIATTAKIISGAENITAAVKGDFLEIKNEIKDTNGELTDTIIKTAAVRVPLQEIIEAGILYNGVVEELNNRLDDVLKRQQILARTQAKTTKEIKDQVNVKTQEAEIEAAKLRLQQSLLVISNRIQANDARIKTAEAAIDVEKAALELAQSRLDLSEQQSDNAIAGLEAQLDLIDRISELELDRIETAKETAGILSRATAVSQLAQTDDPNKRAKILIDSQLAASEQQLRYELQAIAARTAQAQQEAIVREQIANQEKSAADAQLQAARAELQNLQATKQARLEIIRLENDNTLANLEKQRAQAESELDLATKQENLKKAQLNLQIDADKKKATQQAQLLLKELAIIQQDTNLKNQYLTKLSKLTGIKIEGIEPDEIFSGISDSVSAFTNEIDSFYDDLGAKQLANIETQGALERASALSNLVFTLEAIDAEKSAGAARLNAAEKQLDLEIQIAQERVRGAERAQKIAKDSINEAKQSLAEARQSGLNESALAIGSAVISQLEQIEQFIDTLNKETISFNLEADKLEQQIADIAREEIVLKARFDFNLAELQREAALAAQQRVLDEIDLQKQLVEARERSKKISPVESATQVNALELRALEERRNLINLEIAQNATRYTEQENLIQQELAIEIQSIKQRAELQRADIEARVELLRTQSESYKAFLTGLTQTNQANITAQTQLFNDFGTSLADMFSSVVAGFAGAANAISAATTDAANAALEPGAKRGRAPVAATSTISFNKIASAVIESAEALGGKNIPTPGGLVREPGALDQAADQAIAAGEKLIGTVDSLTKAQIDAAKTRAERESALTEQNFLNRQDQLISERDNLSINREILEETNAARLADAADAGGGGGEKKLSEQAERLKNIYLSVFDGVQSAIETSLTGVKDYILYGEGNLREVFVNLLRSIGDTILEQGFIKPLSENLAGNLFGAVTGIEGGRKGIEDAFKNAKVENGAVLVKDVDKSIIGGFLGGGKDSKASKVADAAAQSAEGGGFFSNIFNSIKSGFTNLFGEGGFLSTLLSNFGGFVSNIFGGILKFIGSIFGLGFASGGAVHRAGGGAIPQLASGGGLRDRVPALLEPGEFVLRRAAANRIGMSNLQQMNATGETPSAAPVINIVNEGTAKTAEASQPRFDGEKYVIDIVTRDLQNNGPIRRSLRSGL